MNSEEEIMAKLSLMEFNDEPAHTFFFINELLFLAPLQENFSHEIFDQVWNFYA